MAHNSARCGHMTLSFDTWHFLLTRGAMACWHAIGPKSAMRPKGICVAGRRDIDDNWELCVVESAPCHRRCDIKVRFRRQVGHTCECLCGCYAQIYLPNAMWQSMLWPWLEPPRLVWERRHMIRHILKDFRGIPKLGENGIECMCHARPLKLCYMILIRRWTSLMKFMHCERLTILNN